MRFYVVLVAQCFSNIKGSVGVFEAQFAEPGPGQPKRYLPVFETRVDAEVWADGEYEIMEIEVAGGAAVPGDWA